MDKSLNEWYIKILWVIFDHILSYKYLVDRVIIKCKHGLTALKTLVTAHKEHRPLVLLFNYLVLAVIDYNLCILTLSAQSVKMFEWIQNVGMQIFWGCTPDTPIKMMKCVFWIMSMKSGRAMAHAKAYK